LNVLLSQRRLGGEAEYALLGTVIEVRRKLLGEEHASTMASSERQTAARKSLEQEKQEAGKETPKKDASPSRKAGEIDRKKQEHQRTRDKANEDAENWVNKVNHRWGEFCHVQRSVTLAAESCGYEVDGSRKEYAPLDMGKMLLEFVFADFRRMKERDWAEHPGDWRKWEEWQEPTVSAGGKDGGANTAPKLHSKGSQEKKGSQKRHGSQRASTKGMPLAPDPHWTSIFGMKGRL